MTNTTLQNIKNFSSSSLLNRKLLVLLMVSVVISLTGSAQNTWIKKAPFGGVARQGATGFSIGKKGYIGTGFDQNQAYRKDFWQYNSENNTWTQKADFGGAERYDATGFSIGKKGYIGTGFGNGAYYQDFWEYDPIT
jgi:N-acetylneuraminic acid mutarotase